MPRQNAAKFIRHRVKVDRATTCWNWTLSKDNNGYGRTERDGERLAHRLSFRAFCGEIPNGMEIDHLCENRACVNPNHLDIVTHAENNKRTGPIRLGKTRPPYRQRTNLTRTQELRRQRNARYRSRHLEFCRAAVRAATAKKVAA